MQIRLDSFLSKNGISSRRKAKDLINQRKVSVNGKIVTEVLKVDPENDVILVENQLVNPKDLKMRYIAFHKPINVLSTTKDEWGRKTVLDYVKVTEKVYPVGMLDYNSS
ncbi:MAG TPA: S4 domain-containing protein, partial [bacterium]|nr:S4 domain-containing protein [bacterium]